jgi:DNA repair exonuclease SbcCD ATPase subunit
MDALNILTHEVLAEISSRMTPRHGDPDSGFALWMEVRTKVAQAIVDAVELGARCPTDSDDLRAKLEAANRIIDTNKEMATVTRLRLASSLGVDNHPSWFQLECHARDLRAKLEAAMKGREELAAALVDMSSHHDTALAQVVRLQAKLEAAERERDMLRDGYADIRAKLEAAEEENGQLREQRDEALAVLRGYMSANAYGNVETANLVEWRGRALAAEKHNEVLSQARDDAYAKVEELAAVLRDCRDVIHWSEYPDLWDRIDKELGE